LHRSANDPNFRLGGSGGAGGSGGRGVGGEPEASWGSPVLAAGARGGGWLPLPLEFMRELAGRSQRGGTWSPRRARKRRPWNTATRVAVAVRSAYCVFLGPGSRCPVLAVCVHRRGHGHQSCMRGVHEKRRTNARQSTRWSTCCGCSMSKVLHRVVALS
jgi:hypothetical protein